MRIIARRTLREYGEDEPEAKEPLDAWFHETSAAEWKKPTDVKDKYRNASILKSCRVVFNIAGNKYRLVVYINYRLSIVYIRFVGTHSEYDKINADEV